jgi:hypothetical protein
MPAGTAAMSGGTLLRYRGALVPAAAVAAILLLVLLLSGIVELDRASVPKPSFRQLALQGYPAATPLKEAALVVEAALWWLCLSFVLWVGGLSALALCWWKLHCATASDAALRRRANAVFVLALLTAVGTLLFLAQIRRTPLMSFGLLVDNLDMVSTGFVLLASLNTALIFIVGCVLLLGASLLLLPGAHADQPMQQMRAITTVMYGGAAFLLVWISTATAMYRLAATLLVAEAREPVLKLAPTISLMTGLFLSLLLASSYLAACAWLQHCHEQLEAAGQVCSDSSADGASPKVFLLAHWPKVIAILMPLLPGAAGSVLQAIAQAP